VGKSTSRVVEDSFKDIAYMFMFWMYIRSIKIIRREKGRGKWKKLTKWKTYSRIWHDKKTSHNKVPN
jgi:hypothetical protein